MDAQLLAKSDHLFSGLSIEIKHLRSAVLVRGCGSFRKAAHLLSIRHSALSRSVAQLEYFIGITLFERSSAGIHPTLAGHDFLNRANGILEQLDALLKSAGDVARRESGNLSVGVCPSVTIGPLSDILADCGRYSTPIEITAIERSSTGLLRCLQTGAVDVIFVSGEPKSRALKARALWHEPIFILLPAGHALAASATVYWSDLHGETVLLGTHDEADGLGELLESRFLLHGISDNVQRHAVSRHLIYAFTRMGLGVSFVPNSDTGIVGNDVVWRELRDEREPLQVCFYAHWLPNNENSALKRFLSLLTERYPSPPPVLGE